MNSLIEFGAFVVFLLVLIFAMFNSFLLKRKNTQLKIELINRLKDLEALKRVLDQRAEQSVEKTDGFLKFISESRDWAFVYIEEVQSVLDKFIKDIEPEIEYFKEYGDVAAMSPNYYSMKKIVECYEELKVLLPEDYGKIDI
jgi:hypothetical protein